MLDKTVSISSLLSPDSVALVGASENTARIGGRPLRYLRESGYAGSVYPVNPNRETVQGLRSYASIDDLPAAPDVALLAVPATATVDAVRACAGRGVKACIVFSAGFAEAGDEGAEFQQEMADVARRAGMRLLGPNCLGVFNSGLGFYGTFSAVLDSTLMRPGPVGVVSQSGAYGSHIAHLARQRGLGIGHWVTTGNECDVDVAEALLWMVQQPDVKVVMAYAEGIRDGRKFTEALETARENERAVVFMKVGRSEAGVRAVSSHTAALAGSDEVFDSVLRQYGAWRARTTAEQVDVAYACARGRYPKGNRLGIFTLSGGFGIQMADDAALCGLDVAAMPATAQQDLKVMLPYASPRNPVDATAQALTDLPLMTNFVSTMLEKGGYDFFAGIFGSGPASPTFAAQLQQVLDTASLASRETVMSLTMSALPETVRSYEEKGFLVHEDGSALMTMLGALVHFRDSFARAKVDTPPLEQGRGPGLGRDALSEYRAKQILFEAGIPFPSEILVREGEDAGAAAARVGFPVAVKIVSPDIVHKTEVGGVVLDVRGQDAAREAAATILARARAKQPAARIEGVLVSPMISGGTETIAGVIRDPVFGPVVMFGLGGVLVEVLRDVTFRVAPFGEDEAHRMIREIAGRKLLEGFRGAPRSDTDALAAVLSRLSVFASANADLIESIDLNPLLVLPQGRGVVALDAFVAPRSAA